MLLLLPVFLLLLLLSPSSSSPLLCPPRMPLSHTPLPHDPRSTSSGVGGTTSGVPQGWTGGLGTPPVWIHTLPVPWELLQGSSDEDMKGLTQEPPSHCPLSPYPPLPPRNNHPPQITAPLRLSLGVTQPPLSLILGVLNGLLWLLSIFPIMLK